MTQEVTDLAKARKRLEKAISDYFAAKDKRDGNPPYMVTSWLLSVEQCQPVDDPDIEGGITWANDYASSIGSPNALANLGAWASGQIQDALDGDEE